MTDALDQTHQIVTDLLLDEAEAMPSDARWLVLGGQAALVENLPASTESVDWYPVDVRESTSSPVNVVAGDDIEGDAYDRVILPVPADRSLTRRWILTAWQALESGGLLILAGANAEGGKSAVADASAIFGPPQASHYRQKHRIARYVKTEETRSQLPDWAGKDGIVPGSWQRFDTDLAGTTFTLETHPGVFAGDRVDAGTRWLLGHLDITPGSRMLDVGCGVGIIGIAASLSGAGHVDLVDANLLGVEAATRNLERLGIAGRVIASDVFDGVNEERYDLIVSNPPFHQGKQIDFTVADRLIREAPGYLLQGGRLLIVANAFLAYSKHLDRVFRQVETIAATKQYHVLQACDPR